MQHGISVPQFGPGITTDLDSDRLEDLTAEMRWARYRRGMAAGQLQMHVRLCGTCGPQEPGGVTQARCPDGLRLWRVLSDALEDIETIAECLIPVPVAPPGALF